MAAFVKAQLTGMEPILRRLGGMARAVRSRIGRAAVSKGSQPVLKTAQALAPVGETGLLRKALGRKVKIYRQTGAAVAIVGPRTGFQTTRKGRVITALGRKLQAAGVKPHLYAHLVEGGTKPHLIHLGRMVIHHPGAKPQPFMGPAWQSTRGIAEQLIVNEVLDQLAKEAAK